MRIMTSHYETLCKKESCTAEACDSWWNTNLNCPSHEPAIMWLHYHCNGVPGRVVTNIRIWIQIFFPKIPKIIDPMKSIQSQSQNLTIFPCHILIIILQSYILIILQSQNLTILQSHNPIISQSYNLTL